MTMTMTLRAALPKDREPARDLARRALLEFDLSADFDGIDQAIGRLGAAPCSNLIELVGELDGQFAGCLAIHATGASAAKLAGFYIEPRFRGQGLGRAMLLAAIDQARSQGIGRLHLETMKSMTAALHLYRSLGWRHVADLDPSLGVDTAFVLDLAAQGDSSQ